MPRQTGARFLADALASYGVTHVFFVPTMLSHMQAELERRTDIQRILTHGEKAAVYMADGYARASGRPGVSFAQCVGAANLAAALRDPYLACSPMVVFTGGPYAHTQRRHTYQQIDDLPLFGPLTKYSTRIDDIRRLPDVLRQAFRAATSGTPGPAHIELAGHMGELETDVADLELVPEPQYGCAPSIRFPADPEAVAAAARRLERAQRPVIVAGGGVRTSRAGAALVALAERLAIPIATSMNAKDCVPGDHPLNIGVVGLYSRPSANQIVCASDLVFFVGSHTGSQVTCNWRVPPPRTAVMQLDIDATEPGRHYANTVVLVADARLGLTQLTEAADAATAASRRGWVEHAQAVVRTWRTSMADRLGDPAVPIRPERICGELNAWLPPDTLLVAETGHSGMWTGAMVDLCRADQGYIRAAGSLGWGLPAALGAKLARPERTVVLFSGDGGFWYHLAELETAVRWNIAVVLLINNNRSLNQEIAIYEDAYGGRLEGRHAELWQFRDVSFAAVARAMGAEGIRVERPGDLAGALERAVATQGPCVVEVVSDINAVAPLAWVPEATAQAEEQT